MSAKTPTRKEAEKMAIAFLESSIYEDTELDKTLVSLIRKRCAVFTAPDLFQITEFGMKEVENGIYD